MIIYKITNNINHKIYIGQTIDNLESRWYHHCWAANRYNENYFHHAINKYGPESFIVEPLCSALSRKNLNDLERYFIELYGSFGKNGYNSRVSGSKDSCSQETRKKLSDAFKRNPRKSFLGKKHTKETKKKMSKIRKGRSFNKGVIFSDQTKEKMRISAEKRSNSKLIQDNYGNIYRSIRHASRILNFNYSSIYRVINNQTKSINGYRFFYLNKEEK